MYKTTNNRIAQEVVRTMVAAGVNHAVISPGSRNAPLIIAFNRQAGMQCFAVADERSAAFFAMGLALFLNKPVVIISTSGTAVLNYAPALAEAYYQKIPLIALTADRPPEWIDMADSQAIRQPGIFANYIKKSFQLPLTDKHPDDIWYANRMVNTAINEAMQPPRGGVHINAPFREPLYDLDENVSGTARVIQTVATDNRLNADSLEMLSQSFNHAKKIMILVGQQNPEAVLEEQLLQLSELDQCVVLSETTSNVYHHKFIKCIDRNLASITADMQADYSPDLLITLGGAIISKRIKSFLRTHRPLQHWHISNTDSNLDTYQSLTHNIPVLSTVFFEDLLPCTKPVASDYAALWHSLQQNTADAHSEFLSKQTWSDLLVFNQIVKHLSAETVIHYSNSTPIRYAQLFEHPAQVHCMSNRGTSGIDGSSSTAAGYAALSQQTNVLVTGDISFFYDSNALWNNYLKANFKIIVINNGGGNIFRYIPGPSQTEELETYFETRQDYNTQPIAETFGLAYFKAGDGKELLAELPRFMAESSKPALLEVKTDGKNNAETLINYFNYIKSKNYGKKSMENH